MAIARDTNAANIKPLEGSIVRRYDAVGAINAGDLVHMSSTGIVQCNTANITAANVLGVALKAAASGDRVDVVVLGPVKCLTGATQGAVVYATDTAGQPGETAGTKTCVAGQNESDTVLFVRPFQTVFA